MKINVLHQFFTCAICAALFFSCTRVTEEKIRSYAVLFWDASDFAMELTDNRDVVMFWTNGSGYASFECKGEKAKRYDALCKKFNDLDYKKKTRYIKYIGCREYFSEEILSIDVVSNADFDAERPAGSSLSGIVRFLSASPLRFIQSGYKDTYDWEGRQTQEFLSRFPFSFCYSNEASVAPQHHLVEGLLAELNQDDLQLLGTGSSTISYQTESELFPYGSGYFFGYLSFVQEPDAPGVHELTVTVLLADGRSLSQTIEKTFY